MCKSNSNDVTGATVAVGSAPQTAAEFLAVVTAQWGAPPSKKLLAKLLKNT
jgi:hypothetical protein